MDGHAEFGYWIWYTFYKMFYKKQRAKS
jgi:hypothetical protein